VAIASVNPATGETVRRFTPHTADEVDAAIGRAADAFVRWRARPVRERAAVVRRAGELLEAERDALGRLMTLEMGKPLRAALDEASKCAAGCAYYAAHAEALLAPELLHEADGERVELRHEPLGPVLAVMPWNFPFWQVFRFAAPALVAGNVGLLKHASNVPQCALAIEDLFRRAGAPEGVFQTLLIGSELVDRVVADPRVAAATLTGSEPAGRAVAATAGANLKPTVLELGGSDPFLVMPSAALAPTVRAAVTARTINNGQSCIAAKRFVVHADVYDRFTEELVAAMSALRVGDPLDDATDVGPLATTGIVDELAAQVEASVAAGARLLCGGRRPAGAGNFYPPTVLADVPPGAPAHREELFGPVAVLYRARDEADAVRIANDTPFGLGASVWTGDADEGERLAGAIAAGMVFVNAIVASDPRFPFGGIKHSGYGRELGAAGMRAFMNAKTVRRRAQPADAPQPRSE
jgi:succinate-semialdehyde dehydrogenase/glutarate-semialdehyde dehydrogenase